jgi:hypothetical protein
MGTENVKLGVCKVSFDGIDLGYTKGGVEVEVSTDTHKVTVDQFGESEVNEIILKRSVMARVPMVETTLENLIKIMPGATLIDNGTKQLYTIDEASPIDAEDYTVMIGVSVYTFTSGASALETEITTGLAQVINSDSSRSMDADGSGASLALTARVSGVTNAVTVSGGTMAAVETTPAVVGSKRVDVTNGVGTDLLSISKLLILHPTQNADDDESEDFTIYRAATPGAMSFTYKIDEERVFNIEFVGYPDASNKLFAVGDSSAV